MTFYRRNLPHWQPAGADYFITFRLAGSLPKEAIIKIKQEQKRLVDEVEDDLGSMESMKALREKIHKMIFNKYDCLMDASKKGPKWLSIPEIAEIVKESIHYRDNKEYTLYAYCIMSNHVHLVFSHLSGAVKQGENEYPITDLMASLKKYTARLCNKKLNRTGNRFWHSESYDHVIRDSDELHRIVNYTLQNPVKAGLTKDWQDWPHTYCKEEFRGLF